MSNGDDWQIKGGWILQSMTPIPHAKKILVSCFGDVSLVMSDANEFYVYAEDESYRIGFDSIDAWQPAPEPYKI